MCTTRSMIIALALSVFVAVHAEAFTMEPMTALLAPSGPGSVVTFRISNDGQSRIAIRLRVLTRSTDTNGKEINLPADGLFTVYPGRVLVEPGSTAAVKVQWKGSANLAAEECFRFMAEEVPIDSGKDSGANLRVLFRYVASLYVGTARFVPSLEAVVSRVNGTDGAARLAVAIANRGTRHVVANAVSIDLEYPDGRIYVLQPDALGFLNGANYLPGSSLQLLILQKDAVPGGDFKARLHYESEF